MTFRLLRSITPIFKRIGTRSLVPIARPIVSSKRTFLTTLPRWTNGEVDTELAHQLQEVIRFENTEGKCEPPAFVKEFLDSNIFHIEDKEGSDKVILKRTFGSEEIRVIFSISDINHTVEEIIDERVPEEEYEELTYEGESFPVRATICISKKKGSLVLNTIAQDGAFLIQAVRYFRQGEMKYKDMMEGDIGVQRQDLYMGPLFDDLSPELQATFADLLEARCINTALAIFLLDYVDYKEQREYVRWLKDVNEFISFE
ncbi:mitochondrial glycoprotein [Sporodiniella umbellata]|nr:mitochondrial glycoprotein [Sporodiniella umbellata]